MKKLLFGILVLFLVALVPSVSALVTFTGPILDQDLIEDVQETSIITLSDYFICNGTCDYSVSGDTDNLLDVNPVTGVVDFLAPSDYNDVETVTFDVTDVSDNDEKVSNDVVLTVENDNADITNFVTDPLSSESSPIVIDEDGEKIITLRATMEGGTAIYDIVKHPEEGTLSLEEDNVRYTPRPDYSGTDSFVLKAMDDVGGEKQVVVYLDMVLQLDDAPVFLTLEEDHKLQEKMPMELIELKPATDPDGSVHDALAYELEVVNPSEESTFDPVTHWNALTRTISGWKPTRDDVGELELKLIAYDNQDTLTNPSRDEQVFSLHVFPKYMCEDGEVGDALTFTLDEPEDGDDYGPGDTIYIEVTVENDASDDKDVVVMAMLYDLESHKKLVEVESDEENLDESGEDDDELTFKLELQVPLDSDVDYEGDYVLYVKAYEDGNEDEQCLSDMVELDISRESHEVIVRSMTVTPSTVNPGETVDVAVTVLNLGRKDEEGVVLKLRSEDLEISLTSDARDLGAYDETGSGYVFEFEVEVPLDLEAGTYYFEAYVVFDGGSESTSYIDSPTFNVDNSMVVVEESSIVTTGLTTLDEVPEEETTTEEEFPWSTVMWIVGDIVLIIVAIFFIKLIFSGRKRQPEIKEVKL